MPLYTFKDFPVFMGCVEHPECEDIKTDMNWWISKSSGSIQLNPLLPLDVLYREQHGSGVAGAIWMEHHKQFAEFIARHSCRHVLEIGGGHGLLSKEYKNLISNVAWTIVEPNPNLHENEDVKVIQEFFDGDFKLDYEVDVVVHSHVIEHVYEPDDFILNINGFLDKSELQIFSVPRMQVMLENGYTNCINFEHTVYLTEHFVDYLLAKNGFSILEKKYYQDNHSIFYATQKTDNVYLKCPPLSEKANRFTFNRFISENIEKVARINRRISSHNGTVYLFGGHIFSLYLFGFGLDESKISCILDNDVNKQGKRLYGTSLLVKSPMLLKDAEDAAVILSAGIYNQEIKQDIINNINPNVIFWDD